MLDTEIRERLARYLAGEVSLEAFATWFLPATWNVENEGADATRRLTFGILHLLVEHSNGDLSESDLRRKLGVLGRTYWFEQAPRSGTVLTSSRSVTELAAPESAGTPRVVASA
jgi:hypothetical protein